MLERQKFLNQLVGRILAAQNDGILRVAINGVDGSGKTRLADELTPLLRAEGVNVIRASIDGFHNPRAIRYAKGKNSAEGFYHDSFDLKVFQNLLLKPLSQDGNLHYKTTAFDHVTDSVVDMPFIIAKPPAILLVDGIFLFNEVLKEDFELKIFLDVAFEVSYARMAARDGSPANPHAAENKRYYEGQKLYLAECKPRQQADILIDYNDLETPRLI
ncbi:MAG: uridine kinase [Alphaproteobacteria bacterium]|nr:uridine kinase [Alphaproteobacteria bacterium]